MLDDMWTPIMQAICLPGHLIQGLLSLSIIPQSYGTVRARTQWSHQALVQVHSITDSNRNDRLILK